MTQEHKLNPSLVLDLCGSGVAGANVYTATFTPIYMHILNIIYCYIIYKDMWDGDHLEKL